MEEMNMNPKVFITISHIDDYAGFESCRPDMAMVLRKDRSNPYDDEAIAVYTGKGAKLGYVANSVTTVCRGTHSAGRIYDLFQEDTTCIIRFVSSEGFAIAELS